MPEGLPDFADAPALADWLGEQRNDLESAAIRVQPVVATVLAAIGATRGCLVARMSGSGATCFGLYDDPDTGPHERDPNWIRHEAILLDSPFARLESFGVIERRALDVETLVQRALSMGSTSPSHLGEKMAAMVAEIRAALADVREEVVETSALVAWR